MSEERPYWLNDGQNNAEIARYVQRDADFVEEVKTLAENNLYSVTDLKYRSFPTAFLGSCKFRRAMVEALYLRLSDHHHLKYDHERDLQWGKGQRVRLPDEIAAIPRGACIDLTLLFLSCLASVHLWPIYIQIRFRNGGEHALPATWLDEPTTKECFIAKEIIFEELRKPVQDRKLLVFDSTGFAEETPNRRYKISFAEAQEEAKVLLFDSEFLFGLDIRQVWASGIEPIPLPAQTGIHSVAATTALPPIWRAHHRNPNFTGRRELLDTLRDTLTSSGTAVVTQAIHGGGGVGKTQLALQYTYLHVADYDLVWWVAAEEPTKLATDYAALAERLELPQRHVYDDQELIINAVRDELGRRRNWLLVFDNVLEPEAVQKYLPQGGAGHVIFTSQNPNWGSVAQSLEVRIMERPEAVQFLVERTKNAACASADEENERDAADKLAEAYGNLPIFLEAVRLGFCTYSEE